MFTMNDWLGLVLLMLGVALLIALIANVVIQLWRASRALLVIWRASRNVRAMPMPVAKCVICGMLKFDGEPCGCKPIFYGVTSCRTRPMTNDEIKALLPTAGDMSIGYYVGGRLGSTPCEQHEFPPGPHVTKTCLKCGAMVWLRECKRDFTPGDKP